MSECWHLLEAVPCLRRHPSRHRRGSVTVIAPPLGVQTGRAPRERPAKGQGSSISGDATRVVQGLSQNPAATVEGNRKEEKEQKKKKKKGRSGRQQRGCVPGP